MTYGMTRGGPCRLDFSNQDASLATTPKMTFPDNDVYFLDFLHPNPSAKWTLATGLWPQQPY